MKKIIGVAVVFVVLGLAVDMFFFETTDAQSIVAECASMDDHAKCYEDTVPNLYPKLSIAEVFDIVRDIRREDPSYQFCHVLAHKLGQQAVLIDKDNWLSLMPLNPADGMCSNGFMHGVILGRFRDSVLDDATIEKAIPDFARACEPQESWKPSSLDQAICYHGLGHLFMFITDADIPKALMVCDRVSQSPTGDFGRVCREGVFMQIYQPLEPDDFTLLESLPEIPTKETYRRLCRGYDDEDEGACLREAWPLLRTEIMTGGKGIAAFCAAQPNQTESDHCFETALTIVGRQTQNDRSAAGDLCTTLPSDRQAQCYTIVAQSFIEEDRAQGAFAISVCRKADDATARSCAETLRDRVQFLFGPASTHRDRFCAALKDEFDLSCR